MTQININRQLLPKWPPSPHLVSKSTNDELHDELEQKKKTAEEDEIKKLTKEFDHASFQNIFHNIPLPLERQPTITKIIVLSFFKGLFDAMFDTIALWPHVAAIVVQSDKTVF